MDTLDQILTVAGKLTVAGLLLLICYLWFSGRIVTGSTQRDRLADKDKQLAEKDIFIAALTKDRDEWKATALSYMHTAKRAVSIHKAGKPQ